MGKSDLKEVWDKVAEEYSEAEGDSADFRAHREMTAGVIGDIKGKTILDVGSGTGITNAYLAELGGKLTLIDISDKALDFSRRYFKKRQVNGIFIRADAFKMPLKENSFDVVWNSGVIEHFPDAEKISMIREMWKRVKKGGKLIIMVPNRLDIPFMIAKQLLRLRHKWAFGEEDDLTCGKMKKLFESAGVPIKEVFAYNPITGWWFFPYGREVTDKIGLNNIKFHKRKWFFGHIVIAVGEKS